MFYYSNSTITIWYYCTGDYSVDSWLDMIMYYWLLQVYYLISIYFSTIAITIQCQSIVEIVGEWVVPIVMDYMDMSIFNVIEYVDTVI